MQVIDTTQMERCPNCQANTLPNGQPFSMHWDMLAAICKLRSISRCAAAPAAPAHGELRPSGPSNHILHRPPSALTSSLFQQRLNSNIPSDRAPVVDTARACWAHAHASNQHHASSSQAGPSRLMHAMHDTGPQDMHAVPSMDFPHVDASYRSVSSTGRSSSGPFATLSLIHISEPTRPY